MNEITNNNKLNIILIPSYSSTINKTKGKNMYPINIPTDLFGR